MTALPGCHIHYFLMTHSPIQLALHLLPENVFVGAQDDIPGIFNKTEGGMSISPLGESEREIIVTECHSLF